MRWGWVTLALLLAAGAGARRKHHKHQKLGRALSSGLQPAPVSAEAAAVAHANATCGELGQEDYCRELPAKRGTICDVCDAEAVARAHPLQHALDGDAATWWQSPTLARGERYQHVSLLFQFPDELELMYVILKSGPSPRPLAWSLEISTSAHGDDWTMIRAFGDRDQCWRLWGLRPERRRRRARAASGAHRARRKHRADNITCSTQFASPRPLQNGEMHVGLGEGEATLRVRISFRASHPGPPEQRYYTLRTLVLGARCRCHGHAHRCSLSTQGSVCECQHGTCGNHCERCCSGEKWSPGLPCGGNEGGGEGAVKSDDCSCAERGACAVDDSGAILCVNCTENRAGPLCDRCLSGFYNSRADGPCKPCPCHPIGSDGTCKWDKIRNEVSCNCLVGFAGSLCDSCADAAAVFPDCATPATTSYCKCDSRGVVNPEDACVSVCECKAHVTGETCSACKPGYYGLNGDLVEGCRRCYCSGVTELCAADPDPGDTVELPLGESSWFVVDAELNETHAPSLDDAGHLSFIIYEVDGWKGFFWLTELWNGTQLDAYGGSLVFQTFWGVMRGDTGGVPTVGPDVILITNDGIQIASNNTSYQEAGSREISVPLVEGQWYRFVPGQDRGEVLTRAQFMEALSDVRALMLRAQFHSDEDEVRLEKVRVVGGEGGSREVCGCPAGYEGAHCEHCAWSHARLERAPGSVPRFECVPCPCNGHADCDVVDGTCGECHHNTTGVHCERCLPGHYGNPTVGPCRSCACPLLLPSNNFSPNCALAAAEGDEYVCTQCPRGYTGDHCELCDFGYWGSPTTPGGVCAPCACDGAPCDQNTGECLKCPPHAEGVRCDQCEEGYWQDPNATLEARVGVPCRDCGCGPGALSAACDQRTGHCVCRDGWTGRACDRCDHGHGNAEAGCPACRCGVAALSPSCDPQTGFCECAGGAATPSCDVCLPEYYGLTDSGCIGCNCSSLGAEGNSCDIRTGQCRCRPHVTGRACDRCQEGYWGLSSEGCRRCSCGPGAAACDRRTGACACAPGVGGARCDACLPGYYGFGPAGCLSCPPCGAGKVCEASSGRCVCPARSRGAGCRACAPGHWRAPDGCRPCDCGAGALTATCDPHSGQCSCRAGWAGRACDACAGGHHGPRCRPCACDRAGTRLCDETGMCPCDDSGQCDCKDNVEGEKCDVCRAGTFGLSAENPVGCTACFCFGRSAHCTQAGLTRAAVHAATPRRVVLHHHQGNIRHHEHLDMNSLLSLPPETLEVSLPAPPAPVYMELDKRFLGDRVTSYGGLLQFTVLEEGGEELSEDVLIQYPLVRLYAAHSIVLDFFQRDPAINGTHYVRFHESLWRARAHGSEAIASRAALMVALSDLKRILVRVTTRTAMYGRHVHASLLNVSLDTAIPGGGRSATALGVELCACPSKYAASSCHQPAVGFWQPPLRVNMHHVAGTIVIDLEGDAQPCYCNGRARTCDPVTGHCLNCSEGTGGPRCEVCAEGYHGTAETGCQACPCPERARNFATSCIFTDDRLQCLCKPGYAGTECESCASGWWRAADGACAPCHCDPRGALIPHCDHFGRCQCREFATGTKCDRCKMRRTFFGEDGCQPCDSCSQTLLDGVEELIKELDTKANIEGLSRIPKPYPALQQFHANYTTLSRSLDNAEETSRSAKKLNSLLDALENKFLGLKNFSDVIKSETFKQDDKAQSLSLESMSALEQILSEKAKIAAKVTELDDFARGERHMSAHRALKEARHLLHAIRQIGLIDYVSVANNIFDTANLKSTSVKELNYRVDDALGRAKNLLQGLDQWHLKINDLNNLTAKIWKIGDRIMETAEKTRPKLSALKDTHLRTRLVLEDVITLNNHNFTNETAALISEAQLLLSGIPILASELTTLMTAAEEKAGILHNLIPKYKHKYVEAAERHVAELHAKAKNYMSLFAEARGGAAAGVEASRAWARVSDALQDATAAADGALVATRKAAKLVHGPLPLINRAHHAKDVSARQKVKGEEVLRKAEDLRAELERLRRGTERVSVALRGLGWQERELGARPQADVSELLRVANEQSDRVFSTTRVLYDEASEFRRRARYYLRPQLAELQRHGDTALGAAQEHVSQIRGNTLRANEVAGALADAAEARAHEHRAADLTLSPALAQLRDKIAKAKHAADSISVSLTSVQGQSTGCSRSYIGSATPTAITRVTLAISFDGKVHDGPLLWLGNREGPGDETQTYLQLLVRNQKLQLTWNLGDGEGVVDHPETLQPTRDDLDHTSYRIELERVWNTVRLSVERIGGGSGEPVVASNATGTHVTLVAPELWLGSPKDSAGLPGCVHALYYDDKRLGLWNFISQPEGMRCTGCTQRWYGSSRSGATLAWFDGSGYAELRRSELRPPDRRHFSVALAFRTRDEDAVLFVTHDATNNRSLSVSLRSCRVVFRVEYAAAAALEIVAAGRHCHGRPVHVQAIRVFAKNNLEKGSLRVNGEETLGSPEPPVQDAGALPDLSNAPYWLGGVPPGALLAAPPLLGCLGALMVDREGYDLLNTPRRYGVEARCGNRVLRSVMLRGSGWVELPSPGIRRRSAIGLSFVAQQPRGLLLLRAPSIPESDNEVDDDDTDDQHHLSLALVDGELEVSAAAGKSELRLRTNGSALSDGLLHTVRIVRAHKQLELWVDERMVAHGSLAGGAIAPRPRGLYLGGAPAHLNVTVKPRVGGFSGTITDLIVDGTLIGMENAVNWNSAALGRAQREPPNAQRAALRPLHAPTPTAQCTKSSSYTVEPGAVKFGDAAQSHATLRPAARALRDLALSMQFRTFRPEGLLLLAPGSKSKPKHYLALSLREGHLRLVVRGRRRRELNLQTPVADGAWRSVTIRVSPGRLVLASGGTAATAKPPRKLGLAARLYVGGLPDRAVIPNVPDNISRASGFVGCVRRVTVGGRAEDLVRDAAHHHRVGQCFPRVEPAAFFAGDAYTTWSSAWTGAGGGGGGAKIRIEFRTSEMTGVLLVAQNFVLEIREGALVLTRRSPTGEQTKVECRGVAETALCDDSWHEAAARVSAGVLELSVDAGPARVLQPPQLLSDDADATNAPAPLYIGGLPESASEWWSGRENFKGCLRTVTVDGERRDWPKMQELHNVLIDSCPIPQ